MNLQLLVFLATARTAVRVGGWVVGGIFPASPPFSLVFVSEAFNNFNGGSKKQGALPRNTAS